LLVGEKATNIVRGMSIFTDALEKASIRSILVINMMSDRFYGDKLTASAARRPAHPHIDDLVERLKALPSVRYVDSTSILRQTMLQRQVFHTTDFHWNDAAVSSCEGRSRCCERGPRLPQIGLASSSGNRIDTPEWWYRRVHAVVRPAVGDGTHDQADICFAARLTNSFQYRNI
jgi:hypothetical protein